MTGNIGGNVLLTMAGYFASLSLFAFGGANAAIPDMQRISVDVMHWMTAKEFADTFAIAQMSPGPNVIIVALIAACCAVFQLADRIERALGKTGRLVVSRLLGVILAALAVQFVADGVMAIAGR